MYVLLLSQSQLLSNLNGVVGTMNDIEVALADDLSSRNVLELILGSLRLVVPYHHAEIILQNYSAHENLKAEKHVTVLDDLWRSNDLYRAVFTMNQPLNIEDVHMAPGWKGTHAPPSTRTWMGVPLADQNGIVGLLSLSRFSVSPFNNNEKELAQVFARYINTFLVNQSRRMERIYSYSRLF
jgi:transcriptional regulator with GAF, ATPase, and Fis domain